MQHLEPSEAPRHLEVHLAEGVRLQAEVLDAYPSRGIAVGGDGVHGFQLRRARSVADVRQALPLALETAREFEDDAIGATLEVPRADGGWRGGSASRYDTRRTTSDGGRS